MRTFTFQSAPTVATSIWEQQGSAIFGDAADDYLGFSVALSADAKTLVAGARYSDNDTGYVKVYRMTDDGGGTRTQLGQTIYGNATRDRFGYSVDVTPEGNVIVVGSPGDYEYNDRPGYVQVFSLDGDTGTWKQVGQDIAGEAIGNEFGRSVSISDDGETIEVGATYNGGKNGEDSGHVRMYSLADDGASWKQIGEWLADDMSGHSVSLSANGSIVAIVLSALMGMIILVR
jgi:6-phosphogluconolactonase (cycloisomerase 2 family)